jgi:hypothetical protein
MPLHLIKGLCNEHFLFLFFHKRAHLIFWLTLSINFIYSTWTVTHLWLTLPYPPQIICKMAAQKKSISSPPHPPDCRKWYREMFFRFTYIRSKDGRSKDKRSNDKRPKDKRSNDKRSNDKRSNDRTSKDKRSKKTEHRMTEHRIGPNIENDQNFYTIKIF